MSLRERGNALNVRVYWSRGLTLKDTAGVAELVVLKHVVFLEFSLIRFRKDE